MRLGETLLRVGLRPGEKLYEELFLGHDLVTTQHPRIQMAKEQIIPLADLEEMLKMLHTALESENCALLRKRLTDIIAEDQGGDRNNLAVATLSLSGMDA